MTRVNHIGAQAPCGVIYLLIVTLTRAMIVIALAGLSSPISASG